jgi:MFS family permease
MLPLELFAQRNFAVGNASTLAVYGGLGASPFFLVLFLQQVGGYNALEAGLSTLPVTVLMFTLSRRFGALADRIGPRVFMGAGPVVAGAGIALFARIDASADYLSQVLPAVLLFGLGLSLTVAPLTATVLGGVPESEAGMASAINNAVARIGSLLAVAAIGALVATQLGGSGTSFGSVATATAEHALHVAVIVTGALVAFGGVLSAIGIENPRHEVAAVDCPGGSVVGASRELAATADR